MLYLAFIGFWLAIGAVAFQNGNPTQILLPTDTSGNICGEGNKIDEKYLMYFDVTKCRNMADFVTGNLQCPTYQMCTDQCPQEYWSYWTNAFPAISAWDLAGRVVPFSTIICGENNNTPDICVDMDKFICKPQFRPRIEQIIDDTWPQEEILSTLNSMIENGDCAPFYFPSGWRFESDFFLLHTGKYIDEKQKKNLIRLT